MKAGIVVLWLNSYSLLDSCSEFEATQLAYEMMGWGTFYYQKAIPIFRTSLENYITLLNVYHINLLHASAAKSGSSGDNANSVFFRI